MARIERLSERAQRMLPSTIRELLSSPSRAADAVLSLGGGLPPPEALPFDAVADAADRILRAHRVGALQYAPTEGDADLRARVAADVTALAGRPVPVENIVITTGSQQALDLLGRVLLDRGDVAVVESPTYVGALRALAPCGARLVPVRSDGEGIDTDQLETALTGGLRPKLCYLVATFSNPNGATLTAARRRHLAELATRYQFLVVEDDPYRLLRFRGEPIAPVAAHTTEISYLGSFSKIVAPGLRVGYVSAPDWLARPLALAKQAADLNTSSLAQALVAGLLEQPGWLDGHVERLRRLYAMRADALLTALDTYLAGHLDVLARPDGGMFAWATIRTDPITAPALAAAALAHGVAVVPGEQFAVDGGFDHELRLSFSMLTPLELDEAVCRLASAFATLLGSRP
ncbi:MAG TPA: PLP-dependent aminotransferase family protein [Acidimicrobiales bacterium]|nr:PLP-dependent aminotransferase family protein [Acidimicrobiales bacterium]